MVREPHFVQRPSVAAPASGSSSDDPIPLGVVATAGEWRVGVSAVTPDASATLLAHNENTVAATGHQPFVARVIARYRGAGAATFDMDTGALGPSGAVYDGLSRGCGDVPDGFPLDDEVASGNIIEGNLCWEVQTADADALVMFVDPQHRVEDRVFFSLAP